MSPPANKSKHLVILGAGKPHFGVSPSALVKTSLGCNQLQWLLAATSSSVNEVIFIGGYCDKNIIANFPELKVITNTYWEETGSFGSLLTAPLEEIEEMFVSYSDILFYPNLLKTFNEKAADIVVAHDSLWLSRYPNRDKADINAREQTIFSSSNIVELGYHLPKDETKSEFIGLVWFSKKVTSFLSELSLEGKQNFMPLSLSQGINLLKNMNFSVDGIDVKGNWAELRDIVDIRKFALGTKAETLDNLKGIIKNANILDQVSFTVKSWKTDKEEILSKINYTFPEKLLAVRSSSSNEDTFEHSNAGAFFSQLNVELGSSVREAINNVISSYKPALEHDQILVQPMIDYVKVSGVVFSRTLTKRAPWYVINYENSSDTTSITSGNSHAHETIYVSKNSLTSGIQFDAIWKNRLIDLVIELEGVLGFDELDIEFAVDKHNKIYLLQIRPLARKTNKNTLNDDAFFVAIENAMSVWSSYAKRNPKKCHIFGLMPDWNPAEIIGTSPGELAKSLYGHLITDNIWAQQRAEFGYRDTRPNKLLQEFLGRPYVNVNLSFESFIPRDLDDKLADRLTQFYLTWLAKNPKLHDKVEFEVVPTCLTSNFMKWEKRLSREFNANEINELRLSLKRITIEAFKRVDFHLSEIEILKKKLVTYQSSTSISPTERIKDVLEDCKNYGTLPFAHLARCGFIAMNLLKDAQEVGIISQKAVDCFLASVNTVAKDFNRDAVYVNKGTLQLKEFINEYGHLRPGTYDITSPQYQDCPEQFLLPIIETAYEKSKDEEKLNDWIFERDKFFNSLKELGLSDDPEIIENFLRKSISGREYAKFIFTKSLSLAIEQIADLGKSFKLSRSDLSNLSLDNILNLTNDITNSPKKIKTINEKVRENKLKRDIAEASELPNLITKFSDFQQFTLDPEQPNFVGSSIVTAHCKHVENNSTQNKKDFFGKIVIIPRADPGYDWLINCDIAGLITLFGGANSHMAIRCAEFGITAAIGIGKKRYDAISKAQSITIDPNNSIIKVL